MKTFLFFTISLCLLPFDKFYASSENVDETDLLPPPTMTSPNYADEQDLHIITIASTTPTTTLTITHITIEPRYQTHPRHTRRRRTPPGKAIIENQNTTEAGNETTTEPIYYDSESESGEDDRRTTRTKQTTTRRRKKEKDSDSFDKYLDKSRERWYLQFRDRHNLPEPFQLPLRKKIVELENMALCRCPRVYWPVCAKNNITYLNYCVMECLNQDIRRYGPCIYYRRSGDNNFRLLSDK